MIPRDDRSLEAIIFDTLSSSGYPGAHGFWGPRSCLPCEGYYVYRQLNGGESFADDSTFSRFPRYEAVLHLPEHDPDGVVAFRMAVSRLGGYTEEHDYDSDNNDFIYRFTFTPIHTKVA